MFNYHIFSTILGIYSKEVIFTIIILFFSLFLYIILNIFIKKQEWTLERKRVSLIFIRNWFIIFIIFALIFTWRGEIKTFIFSISALTAGLLVAFKEIIQSIVGSFIISSNKLFTIGDMIELENGAKGKVTDKNLLYTTINIQEKINTGKQMIIPNNNFINGKIVNLSHSGIYGVYFLDIGLDNSDDILLKKEFLLTSANELCGISESEQYLINQTKSDIFIELPNHKPYVFMDLSDPKKIILKLKYFCTHKDQYKVEQNILEKYFLILKDLKVKNKV